jgi:hypothetical protein
MLSQIVFIQQVLLHHVYLWIDQLGFEGHFRQFFQNYRIVDSFKRRDSPRKRAVALHQNGRNLGLNAGF